MLLLGTLGTTRQGRLAPRVHVRVTNDWGRKQESNAAPRPPLAALLIMKWVRRQSSKCWAPEYPGCQGWQ
jgi:hypothetical protein